MKEYIFLIESLSVNCGGPARVAALVSGLLAERGHSVELISLVDLTETVKISPKVCLKTISGSGKNPVTWLKTAIYLKSRVKSVDAVIVSGIWGPIDGIALRLANVDTQKLYIRTCGMLDDYILNRSVWKKRLAKFFYVNANLRTASSLLVNTEIEASQVRKVGILSAITIIANGISIDEPVHSVFSKNDALNLLNLNTVNEAKYLLYLGRIHPKKGLDLLLPAFADFVTTNPSWILLVGGTFSDKEYEQNIKDQVKILGLKNVIFLGEISGTKKKYSFLISSAFILPSLSEGFSNAVIEAMSYSLPVIITTKCNFPQVMHYEAGLVCEPQIDTIRSSLFELLTNDPRLLKLGNNARALVEEHYNINTVVDLYENLAN